MKCVHTSKLVNGHDYNRETADRLLIAKSLIVPADGDCFTLALDLPAYVAEKLRSHDWDKVTARLQRFCDQKLPSARLLAVPRELFMALLGTAAKLAIYDAFCEAQARAGNEAWGVPMTLVGSQYPGVANA